MVTPRVLARALLVLLAAGISACSNGGNGSPPDPVSELRSAGSTLAAVRSVSADVKFGPGVVYQGFTLTSATTRVALPSNSDTVLKVKQNDFLVDLEVLTVAGHVYLKVPFGAFTELSTAQAAEIPNLGALFDGSKGLPSILASGTATRRAGGEKIGGVDCDKITTVYSAAQLGQALGGFKPAGDVAATLWVSPGDHLLRRVLLSGPLIDAGTTTTVQVDLHDFNARVSITPPPVASPAPSPSAAG